MYHKFELINFYKGIFENKIRGLSLELQGFKGHCGA
jgi:hypothetical protein